MKTQVIAPVAASNMDSAISKYSANRQAYDAMARLEYGGDGGKRQPHDGYLSEIQKIEADKELIADKSNFSADTGENPQEFRAMLQNLLEDNEKIKEATNKIRAPSSEAAYNINAINIWAMGFAGNAAMNRINKQNKK